MEDSDSSYMEQVRSGHRHGFLACNASSGPGFHTLTDALFSIMVFPTTLLLTQEFMSLPQKCSNVVSGPWDSLVLSHIPSPGSDWFERLSDLLQISLWYQLGDNIQEGQGSVSQRSICALNKIPLCGSVSAKADIPGSQNQGVEVGWVLSRSQPALSSAMWRVLVPKGTILRPGTQQWFP